MHLWGLCLPVVMDQNWLYINVLDQFYHVNKTQLKINCAWKTIFITVWLGMCECSIWSTKAIEYFSLFSPSLLDCFILQPTNMHHYISQEWTELLQSHDIMQPFSQAEACHYLETTVVSKWPKMTTTQAATSPTPIWIWGPLLHLNHFLSPHNSPLSLNYDYEKRLKK